jgi:hypothetical protein
MKAIAAVALFLFLTGCAVLETVEQNPMVAQLTVQQATLRVIDEDPDKAMRALEITRDVREMISVDSVTVALLDDFIRVQIDWSKLSLADAQLLMMLLEQLKVELAKRMGEGVLSPEQKVSIDRVIDWVEDSAKLVIQMRG